jgi:uncharacterized protein (DUF2062 family)
MAKNSPAKPSFMQRARALFRIKAEPHVMAGSVAAAVLCGTSPYFVGIPLMPVLIRVFRLNKVVAVGTTVLLLANPFLIFLMVFQLWLGLQMMGDTVPPTNLFTAAKEIGAIGFKIAGDLMLLRFNWEDVSRVVGEAKRLLIAYAVGGYSFAAASSGITLGALWVWLERRKKRNNMLKRGKSR